MLIIKTINNAIIIELSLHKKREKLLLFSFLYLRLIKLILFLKLTINIGTRMLINIKTKYNIVFHTTLPIIKFTMAYSIEYAHPASIEDMEISKKSMVKFLKKFLILNFYSSFSFSFSLIFSRLRFCNLITISWATRYKIEITTTVHTILHI